MEEKNVMHEMEQCENLYDDLLIQMNGKNNKKKDIGFIGNCYLFSKVIGSDLTDEQYSELLSNIEKYLKLISSFMATFDTEELEEISYSKYNNEKKMLEINQKAVNFSNELRTIADSMEQTMISQEEWKDLQETLEQGIEDIKINFED
jgi:hypothetical protein